MGWACSMQREQRNAYSALWWRKPNERDHEEYVGSGSRIILKLVLRTKPLGRRAHRREGNIGTNIQ